MAKNSDNDSTICAALSYLFVGLIWYFLDNKMRKNAFAKFHANQAIVVMLFAIAGSIISIVPIVGWIVSFVVTILVIVWIILGILFSLSGKKAKMFIVGDLARSINL